MTKVRELALKLPDLCMSQLPSDGSPIGIRFGETGYVPAPKLDPDAFNKREGISYRQVAAMEAGSMFGWGVPGANPDNPLYDRLTDYPYNDAPIDE